MKQFHLCLVIVSVLCFTVVGVARALLAVIGNSGTLRGAELTLEGKIPAFSGGPLQKISI